MQSTMQIEVAKEHQNKPLTPPLKWAGGKRWLASQIAELYNQYPLGTRLVEPFCGAAAVSFHIRPSSVALNDINPHLINFLKCLRRGDAMRLSYGNNAADFARARARFNKLTTGNRKDDLAAARLFYYLNRTCFNGLCRFNSRGEFNVPFGKYKTINYQSTFPDHVAAMKGWSITSLDFTDLLILHNDFLYLDPPYDDGFTDFSAGGFSWKDQVRLVEWTTKIPVRPACIVISNLKTPRIVKLYKDAGFDLKFIQGPRRISCNGDREPVKEVFAVKLR